MLNLFQIINAYLIGYNDNDRQKLRDEVLSTSKNDFKKFGEVMELAFANLIL